MRLSKALCAVVGEVLVGSHATLDALFRSSGAPGEPPPLSHAAKWKEWLFRAGQDPAVDSLSVLGSVLEEFMDLPPAPDSGDLDSWQEKRRRVERALEENGLRYFRFCRVLPQGGEEREAPAQGRVPGVPRPIAPATATPTSVEQLLGIIIKGLRRAMHPLSHRRKGAQALTFGSEYDVQDLLHAMLRPWIADIRAEEFTPSYAGASTRMDFLLPAYGLVAR